MNVLYLGSDRMGVGDDDLGRRLLGTFLAKLAESPTRLDHVLCLNSGIFLTTEGSEVLDSLHKLAARGARIASCGTCLKHFDRKAHLAIGEVGTMDETLEILATADRVIRP